MKLSEHLQHLGRTVAYYPRLAKITGGVAETLFFCQLAFWEGKQANEDGWIRKSYREIEEETGLNRREQQTARRNLRDRDLITEERHGVPSTVHFKVNLPALDSLWESSVAPIGATSCTERTNQMNRTRQLDEPNAPTIKEHKITTLDDSTRENLSPLAEQFWNSYPERNGKKLGKAKALKAFQRLSEPKRIRVLVAVGHYRKACDQGLTLAKDAFRWLGDEAFEDWQTPARAGPNGSKPDKHRGIDDDWERTAT